MAFGVGPLFDQKSTVIGILQIISWYSVLQAFYSLVIFNPPETAIFRVHDIYSLNKLSRPSHIIFISILLWFNEPIIQYIGYSILISLPIVWLVGILPPFEVLVLWSIGV